MTAELFSTEVMGGGPTEERRAQFDVDYTPPSVARCCLERLRPIVEAHRSRPGKRKRTVKRILDVCAGAGVWSMEARRLFPSAHITAVEIRPEERKWLEQWCDEVIIADIANAGLQLGLYDAIVGNPPFSLPVDGASRKSRARAMEVLVVGMRERLRSDDARVGLYVPQSWWQRSTRAVDIAAEHKPAEQFNVPLPIQHRPNKQADQLAYAFYTWSRRDTIGMWKACDLPRLEPEARRWTVVPGTNMKSR